MEQKAWYKPLRGAETKIVCCQLTGTHEGPGGQRSMETPLFGQTAETDPLRPVS